MAHIEHIERAGPSGRARRLVFSDGGDARLTSASVVKELSLEPGATVEIDDLRSLEPQHARDRALRMLGYRDRSVNELRTALIDDGYPADIARAVVDRLEEVELLDDARFAASFVASRTASGFGPRRIARELALKGIDQDAVAHALAAGDDDSDLVERARAVLRGRQPEGRAERDKALRRLLAKGFDMRTALSALEPRDDDEC